MTALYRSKIFWIVITLGSLASSYFSYKYFPVALPLVSIDLKMNREQALTKARELSALYSWDEPGYQSAVTFSKAQDVKIFTEFEGGGKQAYLDMIEKGYFEPYQWQVRHFKQYEQEETNIFFTPQGKAYGFEQTFSENKPGTSLDEQAALALATQSAQKDWGIDFSVYELVENSKEVRPSGRTDYTFVYQRTNAQLQEGLYRLKLMVSGNVFSGLRHEVKIPESFSLRYQKMRSFNNNIYTAALLAVNIVYQLAGSILGLLFLFRRRYIVWRMPIIAGVILAIFQLLANINNIPLLWMYYPTALSSQGFLSEYIISVFIKFLQYALTNSIMIMAAESLTRYAFGDHIQLWNLWKPEVAATPQVVSRTYAGYLFVPFSLMYLIIFYLITTRYFGWWLPSDELINPDILATYLPWITPVATALNAGFKEECLFRAIPLAGAAIIGKKRGNLRLWLIIGFIIQVIIFGAAHASYPTQPAYGRLIELIFVSVVFGMIYLRLGLLTGIIMHYIYDVVLMSLPIFVSQAAGAFYNQAAVILISLIPIFAIAYGYYKQGSFKELAERWYNRAWQPAPESNLELLRTPSTLPVSFSTYAQHVMYIAGGAGLALWIMCSSFKQDGHDLQVTRMQAIKTAQHTLTEQGVNLENSWRPLAVLAGKLEETNEPVHKFIWQQGGKEQYQKLLGHYISPATWIVRFVKFDGPIIDRKEEYQVFVTDNNHVSRIIHRLPESRASASLTVDQARALAYKAISSKLAIDPTSLVEISATPEKQPQRMDWSFTFSNPAAYDLKTGQARIGVDIAGDQVTDIAKYIHLPEEWERTEQLQDNWRSIVMRISSIVFFLIYMLGMFCILRNLATFSTIGLLVALAAIGLYTMLTIFNFLPQTTAQFNAIESYDAQWWRAVGLTFYNKFLTVAIMSFIIALTLSARRAYALMPRTTGTLGIGISLGLVFAGVRAFVQLFIPSVKPFWAEFTPLSGVSIPFGTISLIFDRYIVITTILFMAMYTLDYLTAHWTKRRIAASLLYIVSITFLHGYYGIDMLWHWLLVGLIYAIASLISYIVVLRHDLGLIPVSIATIMITSALRQQFMDAFPQANAGVIFASILLLIVGIAWTFAFKLQQHDDELVVN